MKKLLLLAVVAVAVALFAYGRRDVPGVSAAPTSSAAANDEVLANAFDQRISNIHVEGRGIVEKILPDDNSGGRHQRVIVRLKAGQTILIAHNIDLAPRVPALKEGDDIAFSGEYEWNSKGGVVHWTHRDPNGRHQDGWIRHNGQSFQ